MRWSEIINETSTAGGTAAANVATAVGAGGSTKGAIGVGFDANGHQGIYQNAKPKKKATAKAAVLRR